MTAAPPSPPPSASSASARPPAERQALLRQAFPLYAADFLDLARTSIETTNDLFELSDYVSRAEAQAFQDKRADWLKKFESVLAEYRNAPEVTRSRLYLETLKRTLPRVGRSMPTIVFSSVVLPAPFGPMTAMASPGCASRLTSRSTGVAP